MKKIIFAVVISGLLASAITFVGMKRSSPLIPLAAPVVQSPVVQQQVQNTYKSSDPRLDLLPSNGVGETSSSMGIGAEHREKELAALNDRFQSQRRDVAWSAKTEEKLRTTMTSDVMVATEIVPASLNYSCRADLCLVKADFAHAGDAQDWAVMLITAAGTTFANAKPLMHALPNGKTELQLFASRP